MLTLGTVSGSWTTPDDKPLHAGDPSLPRRQDPGGLVEVGGRGLAGDGMLAAHGTMPWVPRDASVKGGHGVQRFLNFRAGRCRDERWPATGSRPQPASTWPVGGHYRGAPRAGLRRHRRPYLGRTPAAMGDKLRVLKRGSDVVLAEHYTPVRRGVVATTLETVRCSRPERVSFRLVEEFVLQQRASHLCSPCMEASGSTATFAQAASTCCNSPSSVRRPPK